jgi:processive 1,2-diacylglycerol beta-glucosyltransferase
LKRILILSASFGEGHNSAARGVRDGLARVAPDSVVELHDLFAQTYPWLNERVRRAYLGLINRWPRSWGIVYRWLDNKKDFDQDFEKFVRLKARLARLLQQFQPDCVVSTFPAYPYLVREVAQLDQSIKNIVIVTDSITVNAIWCRAPGDYFLLPNEQSAEVVRAGGVEPSRVKVFGFPVNPKFADFAPDRSAPLPARARVLYMINAGTRNAPETVQRLLDRDIELTVTVGRDEKLRRAIEEVGGDRNLEIIGWTDQMPRLLSESHVLIGKAGGATVQETIAAACPMIVNHVVSGQEEGNARLIVQTKSGVIVHSPAEVAAMVDRAFSDQGRQWREWEMNISRLSRPRASLDIAEFLLSI